MIYVTAAIFLSENAEVLIAQRSSDKDLPGLWEFPGGKIEPGESAESCLLRELNEEFSITAAIISPFLTNIHHYPDKTVCIYSFLVTHGSGHFELRAHQEIRYVPVKELLTYQLAPADLPIAEKLMREKASTIPHDMPELG